MTARLVVLASGRGSNLQALIDAGLPVVAVVSDQPEAGALERARRAGIAAVAVPRARGEARTAYDERLAGVVDAYRPTWVVLAGWMRLLTMAFLGRYPNRVVNLHPALPGEFPGLHAIERAWAERSTRTRSGVMVHLVPDEGVDDGPVLATAEVPLRPDDTLEAFEARVHAAEHALLVEVVRGLVDGTVVPAG